MVTKAYIDIVDVADRKNYVKYSEMEIRPQALKKLELVLEKVNCIVISQCVGYTMNSAEFTKTFSIPFYYTKFNQSNLDEYNLIMICDAIDEISEEDRDLVEDVFGLNDGQPVIWFNQNDVLKWTNFSPMRAILYYNANGQKMYFVHSRFSPLFNQQEVSIRDGECRVFINSKLYHKGET